MSPNTLFHEWRHGGRRPDGGVVAASAIAILFAIVAAISFAIDQNITLSNLPEPPTERTTR